MLAVELVRSSVLVAFVVGTMLVVHVDTLELKVVADDLCLLMMEGKQLKLELEEDDAALLAELGMVIEEAAVACVALLTMVDGMLGHFDVVVDKMVVLVVVASGHIPFVLLFA